MTIEAYKNNQRSIDERVEDLLARMTLKEKVGQLNQKMYGWRAYEITDNGIELTHEFREEVAFGEGMGALYGLFRADPWSGVTFANGIPPQDSAKVANKVQRYMIENTRLGIPVLLSEECPHGHQALGSTLFPTNLGIGATWNPALYEQAYACVAAEVRGRGAHLALVSALDILKDPRWGRSEECYSEDPFLAARMTTAVVRGLQGDGQLDVQREDKLIAVLKHFCAQGACVGGHNTGPASIGQRELNEIHLPGMKAGVAAGALACMAAYNEIDGLPCNADPYLLTEVLRNQWGFRGVVMADGGAVDRLLVQAGDHEAAAALALTAGLDLSLWDTAFTTLESAFHHGKITETAINVAVSRVLRLKFLLGLFDRSYTDESLPSRTIGIERSRTLNLRIAQESIVLLKNQLQILPLKKTINRIAVIGPNADSLYNQLGDYTSNQLPGVGITILEGIRRTVSKTTEIRYAQGCGIRNPSKNGFNEAMAAAKDADVIILVLGGCSTRDFDVQFDTNGAAIISDTVTEMDCGEGVDIADLELGGVQVELAKQLVSTGIPVIVVLIQGRPHAIPWIADHCDAVLCGWYPGQEGGQAIADVLFGDYNPNGKLPVSIPYSTSQLPVHYNYKDIGSSSMNYLDMPGSPLFSFGFGLSYSSFAYSDLRFLSEEINIDTLERGERLEISVHVSNVGGRGGAEVVQLYIRDLEASVTRRVQELKGFEKIWLDAGECRVVRLSLGYEELAIWNREMHFLVEPGNVEIQVGGSSTDTLKGRIGISR